MFLFIKELYRSVTRGIITLPHKLNMFAHFQGIVFTFGKNAFSSLAFSGMCKQFVWQQTEQCVFRWHGFGCATFLLGGLVILELQLQKASTGDEFQLIAKKYVINMTRKKKKLHIKNNCPWSRYYSEFYSFDNLAEAKNCGVESTLCEICFKGDK